MAKLLVLYRKPSDEARFLAYYAGTHIPLAKTLPGLVRVEASRGPVGSPQGESPYFLAATLTRVPAGLHMGMEVFAMVTNTLFVEADA